MRKYLLMGAALSLFAVSSAYAANRDHRSDHHEFTVDGYIALAASHNGSESFNNTAFSKNHAATASTDNSFSHGSKGLMQQSQNAGANSTLQNALSVAYIKNSTTNNTIGGGLVFAGAGNYGSVNGASSSSGAWSWRDHDDGDYLHASIGSSYNGATGVGQTNQNVGDNSTLQNSTSIAAVRNVSARELALGGAMAGTDNDGFVAGNGAFSNGTNASGAVNNSYNGSTGIFSLNQNAGANSLMQNSVAVGDVTVTKAPESMLAGAVALTSNSGELDCNVAGANHGSAGVSMGSSFNGSTGILQASQNAGANSLVQNTVAVAAVH